MNPDVWIFFSPAVEKKLDLVGLFDDNFNFMADCTFKTEKFNQNEVTQTFSSGLKFGELWH